ncbi:MAG TPA: hypothetical protein VGA49_02245 [Patescibacteria group bacterium]
MINNFQKIKFLSIVSLTVLFILAAPLQIEAQFGETGLETLDSTGWGAGFDITKEAGLSVTVGNIIKTILGFLGITAVIIVLYGGFMWMTAGGNEEKVTKAKTLLRNAAIGFIIIAASYAITFFVVERLQQAALGG